MQNPFLHRDGACGDVTPICRMTRGARRGLRHNPPFVAPKPAPGTNRAFSDFLGVTNMHEHPTPRVQRSRFRDSTFLLVIAVLALVFGGLSLYLRNVEHSPSVTATTAGDERPPTPLPAGPRKYP
jgi:hypothetical protein